VQEAGETRGAYLQAVRKKLVDMGLPSQDQGTPGCRSVLFQGLRRLGEDQAEARSAREDYSGADFQILRGLQQELSYLAVKERYGEILLSGM